MHMLDWHQLDNIDDHSPALAEQVRAEGGEALDHHEGVAGLARVGLALHQQLGGGVRVLLERGGLGDRGVLLGLALRLYQVLVFPADRQPLELAQPHVVAADLPQRRLLGADRRDLVLAVPRQFLEVRVPPAQVVLETGLLDDSQRQQFRTKTGEGSALEELPGSGQNIILEEGDEGGVDHVFLEEDACSEVEVEEGDEGGMLDIEVHGFEDGALGQLVVLLGEGLVGVALVAVEVGHVLVQLHRLPGHHQRRARPKLLAGVQLVQGLEDMQSEGEGFGREEELVADGGEEDEGVVGDLYGVGLLGGGPAEGVEVVAQVEVEGTGVLGGLDGLALVVVDPAAQALQVPREAVLAVAHLSLL